MPTSAASFPYNRVYSTDGQKSLIIAGTLADSQLFNGQDLRRAGIFTSTSCEVVGYVRLKYWFFAEGGLWAAWGRNTNCTAVGGDSGGPIWHTNSSGSRFLVGFASLQNGIIALQGDALVALNLTEWCTNTHCT